MFTAWGLLAGALFVLSASNAVTAISLIGLAAATGVWCGVAVLASFCWGVLVAGDEVEHMGQAAAALALILCGIAGVALAAWTGGQAADQAAFGEAAQDAETAGSRVEGEAERALVVELAIQLQHEASSSLPHLSTPLVQVQGTQRLPHCCSRSRPTRRRRQTAWRPTGSSTCSPALECCLGC